MVTFVGLLALMAGVAFLNNGPGRRETPPTRIESTSCIPVAQAPRTALPTVVGGQPVVRHGQVRTVRIVQANMWYRMSSSQFASDLARVVSTRPDFVTLNEAYRRSAGQITPPGYQSWRAEAPFDARETPVLWRSDLWKLADQGTYLMHGVSGKWGIRYTNWATLQARKGGQTVSVISVHASPGGPGLRLRSRYFEALGRLIEPLLTRGPVLISGDFNIDYRSAGGRSALSSGLGRYGARSTFEVLGEPPGGWRTDHRGGTIDYVFVAGAQPIEHHVDGLAYSDHRMLTASVRLPSVPRLVFRPARTQTPSVAPQVGPVCEPAVAQAP